jgi:hypothetical protein
MPHKEYLAIGWPIASGPVEGPCKNLIKDRMERSGMRWTEKMAEAIAPLRAIYLSGDFDPAGLSDHPIRPPMITSDPANGWHLYILLCQFSETGDSGSATPARVAEAPA